MIRQIGLSNYKSYDHATIDLKPITLFCGGNSSGKTAILKSILMLKQSFEATGGNYLLINGSYTDNGLFSNVRHNGKNDGQMSDMEISMSFIIDKDNSSFKELCRSIGMVKKQNEFKRFEMVASFKFTEDPSISQVGEIASTTISLSSHYSDKAAFFTGDSVTTTIHINRCSEDQHYTINLEHFPFPLYAGKKGEYPFQYMDYYLDNCTCYFRGMQLVSLYKDELSKIGTSALPVLYTIFRVFMSEFGKVGYIGPLRETPLRQYFMQDVYSGIGVKGENTAHYLGQFGEHSIETSLPYDQTSQPLKLKDAVSAWADFLGIEQVSINTTPIPGSKVTQIMIGKQNIVDVGFGVSQVLPILVEGLTMSKGNTLILEQPEIHLHPKMQMDIADFLIAMARQGKHLLIETHSDHIINRMVRRALEDEHLREMLQIFFIEKNADGNSELTQVHIHENLGIDEAPQGFFDQYASETEHILQVGYQNLKTKRGSLS